MSKELTFTDILHNALNKDYTSDRAVDDLGKLTNEATLMELKGNTDSPRFVELESIIPIQEKLARAKLDGHPIVKLHPNMNHHLHRNIYRQDRRNYLDQNICSRRGRVRVSCNYLA